MSSLIKMLKPLKKQVIIPQKNIIRNMKGKECRKRMNL